MKYALFIDGEHYADGTFEELSDMAARINADDEDLQIEILRTELTPEEYHIGYELCEDAGGYLGYDDKIQMIKEEFNCTEEAAEGVVWNYCAFPKSMRGV